MNATVVAEGHYLLGDLLRLRGEHADAEAAYLRAHGLGRDPQPGLALLTAQRGSPEPALAALKTALAVHQGAEYARTPLLRAVVDLAVETGDLQTASDASDRLAAVAGRWRSDGLVAEAAHARGAVRLAAGDHAGAVSPLHEAIRLWQAVEAPYACARARILLAQACSALGDHHAASLELDAAERTLTPLNAVPDLERVERLRSAARMPGGLTPREAEILLRVADGSTNKQVAEALVISEKTVSRHLANIYLKLDVSTRTGAVAWARSSGLRLPS
jgi:DNA-binding CsgD family transcriptional regulator